MFKKIKTYLFGPESDREGNARSYLAQAELSERMMWSVGLAMKLGLKVYIRVDIGNLTHAFSVQGKDDPTLQHIYDVANASWKTSLEQANEAIRGDYDKSGS